MVEGGVGNENLSDKCHWPRFGSAGLGTDAILDRKRGDTSILDRLLLVIRTHLRVFVNEKRLSGNPSLCIWDPFCQLCRTFMTILAYSD